MTSHHLSKKFSPIIIKLGGSILTHKKKSGFLRLVALKRITKEISEAFVLSPRPLIIITGAGGVAHALAKRFNLAQDILSTKNIHGAIATHMAVKKVQNSTGQNLAYHGLKVKILQTHNFFIYTNNNLRLENLHIIKDYLINGITPILCGDLIHHPKKNLTVLSGDTIAMILAKALSANEVIFASDIDGIYQTPPSPNRPKQKPIPSFTTKKLKKFLADYASFTGNDVTGELIGKLRNILKKPPTTSVSIINGLKPQRIKSALMGEIIGSKIT